MAVLAWLALNACAVAAMSSLRDRRLSNRGEADGLAVGRGTPEPMPLSAPIRERGRPLAHAVPAGVVDIDVRGGADAPARARRTLRPLLDDDPPSTVDDALLLISEVVANSVVEDRADDSTRIGIRIRLAEDLVHVEVAAPRRRFASTAAVAARVGDPSDTARRMGIVKALASRWDIDECETTRVWFELGRTDSARQLHAVGR